MIETNYRSRATNEVKNIALGGINLVVTLTASLGRSEKIDFDLAHLIGMAKQLGATGTELRLALGLPDLKERKKFYHTGKGSI